MPLHALFFDAAGTLIHTAEPVGQTYAQFALRHGIEAEPAAITQAFRAVWQEMPPPLHPMGQPAVDDERGWWRTLVGAVFGRVVATPLLASTLDDLFSELYLHYAQPQAWRVFDDVVPALSNLAQNHRLLVLSNFDDRLRRILAGHDLLRFFERVIISSEVGAAKPHPLMFQAALAAAGFPPQESLHIGDDAKCDLAGAQSCGIHAFHVDRPDHDLAELVQKIRSETYSGLRIALL